MGEKINGVLAMVAVFLTWIGIESLGIIENTTWYMVFMIGCIVGVIIGIVLSILVENKGEDTSISEKSEG